MILSEYKLFSMLSPKSPISEAFRTLRTNIEFSNVDRVVKRILFTSTGPREGKSSTIANLASMMVQTDKKVLIIDADLRNPTQHKILSQDNCEGLTTLLVDEGLPILNYIKKTDQEGLELLTSGPIPPNPAELLGSKRMKQLLSEAAEAYDIVLIDSPPTIAVTDSSILAQSVDGVVLVLASGEVSRDYAVQAKEQLEKVGAKILGIVLNKMEMKTKEYYYYYSYDQRSSQKA
ncbi:CpsD/CapB family tyrosine-protein kinase [Desulfitobacterium metallireducens]|uniref:non-specific protein-tyrosine kinase n=1 Tax=Desulfitobacterium metallireducens DSM 15288 TaxID=871968 RepID=W0EEQ8_9FIRM|nr:CpsD/CapB family tyrosine-protein kinase [Desulfitobacterium metallireducens]AHF07669.1 tyrosine protein kinase [Desulfitobacterium metallireducens DSM 15288]